MEYLPKVSVIVPVYNVEKYIGRCARSLFEQTLEDIEYIFINDCTPDNSMEILDYIMDEFPRCRMQVKIIEHKTNFGISYTREEGNNTATGKYVIHCDSDDWIEPDMYRMMYEAAENEGADIVGCDLVNEYPGRSEYCVQRYDLSKEEMIRSMLRCDGKIYGYLHERMVRRRLYGEHNIHFPDGVNMWEDLAVSIKLHFFAVKTVYLPGAFYHYEHSNPGSLVKNVSLSQLNSMIGVASYIEHFLKQEGIFQNFYFEFMELAFRSKMGLILLPEFRDYIRWCSLWPASGRLIRKYRFSYYNKFMFYCANRGLLKFVDFMQSVKILIKRIVYE